MPLHTLRGGQQQEANAPGGDTASQQEQSQTQATATDQSSEPSSSSSTDRTASTTATDRQQQQQQQQPQQQRRNWLFGTTRSRFNNNNKTTHNNKVPFNNNQRRTTFQHRVQHRVGQVASSAKTMLQQHSDDGEGILDKKERFLSALGSSLLAVLANRGGSSSDDPQRLLSFGTIYALSLLGASVGFHSFLYFISVGYALGVVLPVVAALSSYRRLLLVLRQQHGSSSVKAFLGLSTLLHSCLVVVWGLRALTFFLWREYVNWPALHTQIRHVNESSAPTLPVKCLIWVMYSFLYTAMLSPCWFRLQQSARMMVPTASPSAGFILVSTRGFHPFRWLAACLPILLQLVGLAMESMADYQKSTFKLHNRYEWCNIGLWTWSTHPNYLGEMIFWTGTYLGWVLFSSVAATAASSSLSSSSPSVLSWIGQFLFCSLGYGFITTVLRGSIQSMSNKHWQKYGHIPEYATFRQSHGLMGPKRRHHTVVRPNEDVTSGQSQQQQEELANTTKNTGKAAAGATT